jgi:hypothetical protein
MFSDLCNMINALVGSLVVYLEAKELYVTWKSDGQIWGRVIIFMCQTTGKYCVRIEGNRHGFSFQMERIQVVSGRRERLLMVWDSEDVTRMQEGLLCGGEGLLIEADRVAQVWLM